MTKLREQKMAAKFHFRSVSLPTRSHPTTARLEEELNKFKSWESLTSITTASAISVGVTKLRKLYDYTDNLLCMASTQEVLARHRDEKCVEESLNTSVKLLDTCEAAEEMVMKMKEHVHAIQSSLRRRRRGDELAVSYTQFRKTAKTEAKRWTVVILKQMDGGSTLTSPAPGHHRHDHHQDDHDHLCAVIRVLREVNATGASIFRSVFGFLATPVYGGKQNRWSLTAARLMQRGGAINVCDEKELNELEIVDAGIFRSCCDEVQKRLEVLEICVGDLEMALEAVFRRLINTRTSLLNILSQ